MITIACVLKSGGPYSERDVQRLRLAVEKYLPDGHRFVCLSDRPKIDGVYCIPLKQNWPGWWSKLELFSPASFTEDARILYFDLDTILLGGLSSLVNYAGKGPNGRLIVLRDFYRPEHYGSGVMAFRAGELSEIYERFKKESHRHIQQSGPLWGDQQFIETVSPTALFWQDLLPPDTICSYKVHCMEKGRPPEGARVVCFHGIPRPGDVDVPWVKDYWQ